MDVRELQMKYLILEDSYRKLEERITKLEVDLSLREMLGINEKLKNTSISLFLLRKDRERLASDLGLSVSDYTSLKSLGELALESLIYENKDVLNELKCSLKYDDYTEFVPENQYDMSENDSKSDIKNDIIPNFVSSQDINTDNENNNSVSSTTFTPMSIEESKETEKEEISVKKTTTKRGRKSKAEKEAEEKLKLDVESKESKEAKEEKEAVLGESFEGMDDAFNMWN